MQTKVLDLLENEPPAEQDFVVCSLVSAKPFLDGLLIRALANGVPRAFKLGRSIARQLAELNVRAHDTLRLTVIRVGDKEYVAAVERLGVVGKAA